jgi:hypothetical protein
LKELKKVLKVDLEEKKWESKFLLLKMWRNKVLEYI